MTASARALEMQDIVDVIVAYLPSPCCLDTEVGDDERRVIFRELAYAQRICRNFDVPARKKIWEEQYGLDAVISMIKKCVSTIILWN